MLKCIFFSRRVDKYFDFDEIKKPPFQCIIRLLFPYKHHTYVIKWGKVVKSG